MSAALVRKSLLIVDPLFDTTHGKQHKKFKKVLDFVPDNKRIVKKINTRGSKSRKIAVLQTTHKLTITEARNKIKSKEEILRENLKKLEAIKKINTIKLDKDITEQIYTRGRTKRPVVLPRKDKKNEATQFTEEDFERFEAEYTG